MNADEMNKCSMIASFHQMTNARAGLWHHFHGDPLFGRIAGGSCRNAMPDHAASEQEAHRAMPQAQRFDRVLRRIGWRHRS